MLKVTTLSWERAGEKKFNDLKKLDITGVMQLNRLLSSVAAKPIRLDSGEILHVHRSIRLLSRISRI